jgi:hypothetical protein
MPGLVLRGSGTSGGRLRLPLRGHASTSRLQIVLPPRPRQSWHLRGGCAVPAVDVLAAAPMLLPFEDVLLALRAMERGLLGVLVSRPPGEGDDHRNDEVDAKEKYHDERHEEEAGPTKEP